MSVRVCFLRRDDRGSAVRAVRLVGQAADDSFPPEGVLGGDATDFDASARWVRERLDATRTAASIAVLCLDTDGGACAWATTPSVEPAVLAAGIRFGGGDGSRPGGGAFDFFAPSDAESSLEPLPGARESLGGLRSAVLGVTDVPGRLFIDALDREGVPVESVSTLWHAMARAWDPGAPRPGTASDVPTDAGPMTAIVLADPAGRLLWCWSVAGTLRCAGAVRLRPAPGGEPPPLTTDEAARLSAEWLSWAVQLGQSPRRVVCVLPPGDGAAALGEALGRAWPGATIDVVGHDDPLGATLRRLADAVEATPRAAAAAEGLSTLGRRPGRAHRAMVHWRAGALLLVAALLAVVGWQLSRSAARAKADAADWKARWESVIAETYPDALRPALGVSPLQQLNDELRRREREMVPVERTDLPMPVLQELETISMVLASASCGMEQIALDSAQRPLVVATVKSSEQAEDILQGLQRIGGAFAQGWTLAMRDIPGGVDRRIRAEYRAEWDREAVKKGGTP